MLLLSFFSYNRWHSMEYYLLHFAQGIYKRQFARQYSTSPPSQTYKKLMSCLKPCVEKMLCFVMITKFFGFMFPFLIAYDLWPVWFNIQWSNRYFEKLFRLMATADFLPNHSVSQRYKSMTSIFYSWVYILFKIGIGSLRNTWSTKITK